jgi:Ca-activated chloride channel family protein
MEFFKNIQFAHPVWFLIVPVSLTVLVYWHFIKKRTLVPITSWLESISQQIYRHPILTSAQIKNLSSQEAKHKYNYFSFTNYMFLLTLLALSLAQPYRIGEKLPEPPEYRDIIFMVDTSVSMVLRDYLVNGKRTQRITVLKDVLKHFVDQLQGNRIQIIAYSEKAYTLVPLTTDYGLIKYQLNRLEPANLTGRSSDLSHALLYALEPYRQTPAQDKDTGKPVFVMLTDADRPVRDIDPVVAAEYVAQYGIRLHTIAIGAASYEAEDKQRTSLVYHPTSFYLLEKLAELGHGQFFWAKDSDSLQQALITINNTEKRQVSVEPEFIQYPLYYWPLLILTVWFILLHLFDLPGRRD